MARSLLLAILSVAALAGVGSTGCHSGKSPELRVLGVHEEPRHDVVFVQVTNPASKPMRLTKLEYTFAADGAKLSEGALSLARDVPAGASVVVEIPLDSPSGLSTPPAMTMSGKLTAELNQIVQIFSVSAKIQPPK
jgi:LEA14-like dessication related protein